MRLRRTREALAAFDAAERRLADVESQAELEEVVSAVGAARQRLGEAFADDTADRNDRQTAMRVPHSLSGLAFLRRLLRGSTHMQGLILNPSLSFRGGPAGTFYLGSPTDELCIHPGSGLEAFACAVAFAKEAGAPAPEAFGRWAAEVFVHGAAGARRGPVERVEAELRVWWARRNAPAPVSRGGDGVLRPRWSASHCRSVVTSLVRRLRYLRAAGLSTVLWDLGLDHTRTAKASRLGLGSHDVWDRETGEILFTGPAGACWEWLRETGRLPARRAA